MNNIKEWVLARSTMNFELWMAILSSETKNQEIAMQNSIFHLLQHSEARDRVVNYWSKMTYNERCIAMEIAF